MLLMLLFRLYVEFNESRVELKAALETFIEGIIQTAIRKIAKAMLGLGRSVFNMASGAPPTGEKHNYPTRSRIRLCVLRENENMLDSPVC